VATCWRHNEELGRGFLLLSTAGGQGRIWRWETGSGPIAIGRTLSVERSGCRSSLYKPCSRRRRPVGSGGGGGGSESNHHAQNDNNDNNPKEETSSSSWLGSGGIAMDSMSGNDAKGETTSQHSNFAEGKLVVAEWGEGRIARMEENGARTPLVIQVPKAPCSDDDNYDDNNNKTTTTTTSLVRVHQPRALLFSPFGDLFFFSHQNDSTAEEHGESSQHKCGDGGDTLLQLKQSIWIEPLESLHASRKAHSWTSMANATSSSSSSSSSAARNEQEWLPKIRFHAVQLGGMTLDTTWVNLYVTAKQGDGTVVLVSIPLGDKEGEEEDTYEDDDDDKCEAVKMETDDDLANKACQNKLSSSTASPLPSKIAPLTVVLNYSEHASYPGPVAIDKLGRIFLGSTNGVLVVVVTDENDSSSLNQKQQQQQQQRHHQIVAHLATPQTPTALTVGEDSFLYISTDTLLLRIRVQQGPVQLPTYLVFQKKKMKR
jgi:hypothetical protein